jgi:hypothetical protein
VLTLENTSLLCALRTLRVNPALSLRHTNLKVGVPRAFTRIFSLCPPCELFFKTCQLKSWRSQLTKYRAVAKRRSAYAAMSPYKSVSRRREKQGRLRRDDYVDQKSRYRFWPCFLITLHNLTHPHRFVARIRQHLLTDTRQEVANNLHRISGIYPSPKSDYGFNRKTPGDLA